MTTPTPANLPRTLAELLGLNLSCCAVKVWNVAGELVRRGATLISPDVGATANHWAVEKEFDAEWVARGKAFKATVIDVRRVGSTDIRVFRIDRPLGWVMPARLSMGMPAADTPLVYPVDGALHLARTKSGMRDQVTFEQFTSPAEWRAYWVRVVDGQSGAPMLSIDREGRPTIHTHAKGPGGGPAYAYYVKQIVSAVRAMGGQLPRVEGGKL